MMTMLSRVAEWSTADGAQVLYGYIKDQPVWNSLRFWTAAYFDLLYQERASAAGFVAFYERGENMNALGNMNPFLHGVISANCY